MSYVSDGAHSGAPDRMAAFGRFLSPIIVYGAVFSAGYLFAVFPETNLGRVLASVWGAS